MSKKIELTTIQNGLALAMFDHELKKVLENIEDENTSATARRKIVLTVDFKPDTERKLGKATVSCISKLAPIEPHEKSIFFKNDEYGEFSAYEDDPKQLNKDYEEAMLGDVVNE